VAPQAIAVPLERGELLRQELEGDKAAELEIEGLVDDPMPPWPNVSRIW